MESLIIPVTFALSIFGAPVEAKTIEPPIPTIQEQVQEIAKEYEVPFEIMDKIIKSESSWRPSIIGDNGNSYGLVQIYLKHHPEITESQALDPLWSARWLASEIKAGREWQWTICSCTAEVRRLGASVPFKDKLLPNNEYPRVGGVIIFQEKTQRHLAYITSVGEDGIKIKEANYKRCERGERVIKFDDPKIIGFWHEID